MPNPLPPARDNAAPDSPPAPRPANTFAGSWFSKSTVNGTTHAGGAAFEADGGFIGTWVVTDANGNERTARDTGTWSTDGSKITIKCEKTGTVVRPYTLTGENEMKMNLSELDVTWVRKK